MNYRMHRRRHSKHLPLCQASHWRIRVFSLLCFWAVVGAAYVHASTEPELLVSPYLGETTTTSTVIAWAMAGDHAGEVRYGIDSIDHVAIANKFVLDGKHWYSAHIQGLHPHTSYQYQLFVDGEPLNAPDNLTFTTAPDAAIPGFRFGVLGDSRPSDTHEFPTEGGLAVAAELNQHPVDLVLHAGDLVYAGGICSGDESGPNQYVRQYFDLYRDSMNHIPFYPSIGNHELGGGDCGYGNYTLIHYLPENAPAGAEEEFYSFDWGNAHFVSIDTNTANWNEAQLNWLEADLQNTNQFWTFVLMHYPAYSSGKHGSFVVAQEYLAPIFEAYGVDAVFAGHDHHYERTCPIQDGTCTTVDEGGVVYYVTGGAGSSLYAVSGDWFTASMGSIYELLDVEIDDCRAKIDAIQADGSLFDSYVIDRCEGPTPTPTATATAVATATATASATSTATPSRTPTPHYALTLPLLQK